MITSTLERIKHLVSIPSTNEDNAARRQAVGYIAALLKEVPGITVEHFEQNGVASLLAYRGQTRPRKFRVLMNGHVDVVPGRPGQFTPIEKDGKLYGRGVQDMKAAAIVMTELFLSVAHELPYDLGLQIVSDEETGGYDGVKYQLSQGVRTDFVIIGEHNFAPNVIYNAARGICWVELSFTGSTSHGAYPWEGTNALLKATQFAHKVLDIYPIPKGATWGTSANIATISTLNQSHNRVPDSATLKIDFRFTPSDTHFASKEHLEDFLKSIDPSVTITAIPVMEPAVIVEPDNQDLRALSDALHQEVKEEVVLQSRYGGSDGRHFSYHNMPAVELGITGNGPHSDEEYINIDNITQYRRTLEQFLKSL